MRIRTVFTLGVGAAAGAGAMYLLDPEQGEGRRRTARRSALAQGRHSVAGAVRGGTRLATEVSAAALTAYRQARQDGQQGAPAVG